MSAGFQGTAPRYNPKHLVKALRQLLSAVNKSPWLKTSRSLSVDVVDLTATVMANEYIVLKQELDLAVAGVAPSASAIDAVAQKMAGNILATDQLLGSNDNYLLGNWINEARSFGQTDSERRLLEFNARNQITLWGPAQLIAGKHGGLTPGSPQDYAGKTWQGLFKDFYLPRQQLLFNMLSDAAQVATQNQSSIDFAALGLNFTMATLAAEGAWGNSSNTSAFLPKAVGDTFALASALVAKHGIEVDKQVWCAVRNAGQTSYNTDKAGATISWQLQSYMQNATCPFPCLNMPWNQGYVQVLGCE
jgi:alpha-N-acetylglucosaminidase